MNIVNCKKGHFFDFDAYSTCPHCGAPVADMNSANDQQQNIEKKKFWNRKQNNSDENQEPHDSRTLDFYNGYKEHYGDNNSDYKGVPVDDFKNHEDDFLGNDDISGKSDMYIYNEKKNEDVILDIQKQNKSSEYQDDNDNSSSLKDAIKNASASNEGKTMSYFSSVTSESSSVSKVPASDPTVGWIVCVGGCHIGETFSIYSGKNSIGRSSENRIVISSDNQVSRQKHALIIYEPKKRNFYLQPGDSSGLTYLNDEYITDSNKLNKGDVIEIGESKFIFVPLCGDDFTWEDYL